MMHFHVVAVWILSSSGWFTSRRWRSVWRGVVRCRRARGQRWCPSRPLPPHETSDHQSRCEAWSSPAWGPSAPRPGTAPHRSPTPRPGASSGPGYQSWQRCELSPSRFGWDSWGAVLWRKTFSGASPEPPGSPLKDPVREEGHLWREMWQKQKQIKTNYICAKSMLLPEAEMEARCGPLGGGASGTQVRHMRRMGKVKPHGSNGSR